jgi:alkylated DNA nucleotide flippase Atl1
VVKRSVDDELRSDVLVDISKDDERRFGCSGKMLKPSQASVEALVEQIPPGKVLTTSLLRKRLAESRNAQMTCPFLTKRALMAIAQDPEATAPYWRVVMGSGEMIAAYPGGVTQQALHLRSEGVTIADKARKSRVVNVVDRLAAL